MYFGSWIFIGGWTCDHRFQSFEIVCIIICISADLSTLLHYVTIIFHSLFVFKINILDLLGTITGGMTSTPGLAAADSMTDSNIPSVAYATVYPIAMVFLILIIQVIASAVY